ncbi:helix-turn-helix transcriptional regulator [Corallococcus exiguus]|nr:helix-turn-helix transcriptional regulator [Corallococcus exiguus]
MQLKQVFGTNLRNHRRAKGLTQDALAERVTVSLETISKIERGVSAPSFETAEKIAAALELSPLLLFGFGAEVVPEGQRGRLLSKINGRLATMNDDQIARVSKMIEAFAGN